MASLPTIKRKNIYQEVVGYLQEYIIRNALQPGDRLPTEAELASQFGISRSSVREAVKVLESAGVVQARPRDGIRLQQISVRHLAEHLKFLLELDGVSVREMAAARLAIETASFPMIVQHADAEDYQRLEAAIARGWEQTERGELCSDADLEFHLALARATKNRVMQGFAGMLHEFFDAIGPQVTPNRAKQGRSLEEHRRIVDALRAGDVAGAQRELDIHLSGYDHYPEP